MLIMIVDWVLLIDGMGGDDAGDCPAWVAAGGGRCAVAPGPLCTATLYSPVYGYTRPGIVTKKTHVLTDKSYVECRRDPLCCKKFSR